MTKLAPEIIFEKLFAHAKKLEQVFEDKCAALNAEYGLALRGKKKQEHDAVTGQFIPRGKALRAWYDRIETAINKALDRLAGMSNPIPTDTPLLFRTVSSSAYSTQGFGASKYAEGDARQSLDRAMTCGLKAEVKAIRGDCDRWGNQHVDYEVWVYTTETGLEILRRKTVNLRDWLKSCWARGVNPRVLNPFLPQGLEEKLGIDYFGKDIVK